MKPIVALLVTVLVAGCTVDVYPESINKAEEVCASNGGLAALSAETSLLAWRAQCNNGAVYRGTGSKVYTPADYQASNT